MTDDPSGDPTRRPKKSEMLDVRLPHGLKQEFLAACRRADRTASDVVREGIQTFIDAEKTRPVPERQPGKILAMISKPIRKHRFAVAGAGVVGLALAVALPSAASPDMKAMFDRMDANKDGVISPEEFASPPKGGDIQQKKMRLARKIDPKEAAEAAKNPMVVLLPPSAGGKTPEMKSATYQLLDAAEQKTMADHRNAQFASFDPDGDGKVTFAEYSAQQTRMLTNGFNRMDKDHDGALSVQEYQAVGQPLLITDLDMDTRAPTPAKIGAILSDDTVKAHFGELDTDKSGKLALAEYLADAMAAPVKSGLALLPDTAVGRLSRGYFEANNTLDPAKLKAFLTKSFPKALANPQFEQLQASAQGLDVVKIETATESRLDVWVEVRSTKLQHKMIILLDDANPEQLKTIAMLMM